MSHTVASPATSAARDPREERKVLAGTLVGTTIEWYDFFIYAQAAALILGPLFFAPMGAQGAQIASWASLGISFLVRPLGAIVAGHMGDRFGRKIVLSMTLIGMGAATVLIGLLPTYAQIGVWAPILLVLLRLLQGFSAGGEWGGAALLSVEHAPHGKRGLFGSAPQVGVPLGMLMATGDLGVRGLQLDIPGGLAHPGFRRRQGRHRALLGDLAELHDRRTVHPRRLRGGVDGRLATHELEEDLVLHRRRQQLLRAPRRARRARPGILVRRGHRHSLSGQPDPHSVV